MKVLFISESHSIHTVKWVNSLAERGHEIFLVSRIPDMPVIHAIDPRVKVYYLKNHRRFHSLLSAGELKRQYKAFRPDIINTHYASTHGITSMLAGIHPNILSVWGSDVFRNPYENRLSGILIRRALCKADCVTSSSAVMAEQCRKISQDKKLRTEIIPFGVDTSLFSPAKHAKGDTVTIGTVKALSPVYKIDVLIRAFASLCKRLPRPLRLVIYGDGKLLSALKQLCTELNIAEKVQFMGRIPNNKVPEALRSMDIFALSSERESFGVAAVEAMACGLPIVATDAQGFCEVIENHSTGFIVPKNNPDAMCEKLKILAEDSSLRQQMGHAGRERALTLYDWEKNVSQMEELYREWANL